MKKEIKISLSGECKIKRIDLLTNKVIDEEVYKNLIVDLGLENISKMLIDDADYEYNGIIVGIGVDTGSPYASDTDLISFLKGVTADKYNETETGGIFKAVWSKLITFDAEYDITEAAISKDATAGDIMNHIIFETPKEVSTIVGLEVTFKITVARV